MCDGVCDSHAGHTCKGRTVGQHRVPDSRSSQPVTVPTCLRYARNIRDVLDASKNGFWFATRRRVDNSDAQHNQGGHGGCGTPRFAVIESSEIH